MAMKSLTPFGGDIFPRSMRDGLLSLQQEIDRVFQEFSSNFGRIGSSGMVPRMDARETEEALELSFELPGLEEKDVDVSLADGVLTIKGEKKSEKKKEEGEYHYNERSYGSFYRSVQVPAGINEDAIKATMSKGVLTVVVPKAPAAKARKIDIKAAA